MGRRLPSLPGMELTRSAARRSAVRDGLGVGIAVGLSGLAFGAAAIAAGLNIAQASALSLLTFSGASQFALVGAVGAGGNLAVGVAGALLLGGRNTLYGLRLADLLRVRGARSVVVAQGVIDETTAVATAQPDREAARAGFVATFASIYVTWNLATLVGALGAARLGDPATFGLDAVVPAAFLALLWPRLRANASDRWIAVLAAGVAIAATPFLPSGVPVLLAAAVALGGALR
ncbi:MAG: branched-chain amino acid ABC transporter permease [Streptosporangiales bacterium]|nr:branched-chain amino acid ABC transporter permease [Streptosporangiales bacterium]